MPGGVERFVEVSDGYRLWVEGSGDPGLPPLLLIMGANASGVAWPDALVDRLTEQHHVVRFDHRDTGRSTHAFDARPYPLTALARDVVAIIDDLGLGQVHAVGMSLGGTLLQVLLVDRPDLFRSATILGCPALDDEDAPGPEPALLELWGELGLPRSAKDERDWQLRHWQLLAGDVLPFGPDEVDELEARIAAHRGTTVSETAHARAAQDGLDRDLASIRTPVLVIDAPKDPVAPPPTAERLAARIPGAQRVVIEGMGHALPHAVIDPLATAITSHTASH